MLPLRLPRGRTGERWCYFDAMGLKFRDAPVIVMAWALFGAAGERVIGGFSGGSVFE